MARTQLVTPSPPGPDPVPGVDPAGWPADAPDGGPVKRVIAAAVGIGTLLMLALPVGLAADAPEAVVTGLALVGAGVGWGVLAAASRRFTRRPQPWAWVPSIALALSGIALAVLRPGGSALTTAGWVWPPALLALTVWTIRQCRPHLTTGQRWLLTPALAVLMLAGVGGACETVALSTSSTALVMPGRLYDVGGYRLHLDCTGTGGPTVVLLSGLGEMSPYWARIAPAAATGTRVCVYDRAGQGWSDSSPHAPDGTRTARDLHALLQAAGEQGPFVLVGHSSGGVYGLTYAAEYPSDVAGMVLLDSSPHRLELVPSFERTAALMHRGLALLPTLARMGVGHLLPSATTLPPAAAAEVMAFSTQPRGLTNMRDEQAQLVRAIQQSEALTSLGDKPLVVLTSREELTKTPGWGAAQDEMAALSTNSAHLVIDVAHGAVLDDPVSAEASIRAIDDVVVSVRTGAPVPAR